MESASNGPVQVPVQLDYETIWLHMKDRFWSRALLLVGCALAAGGLLGYGLAVSILETFVIRYTQTDEFRVRVAKLAQDQVPQLTQQVDALEARERSISDKLTQRAQQAADMESSPVVITDRSLEWSSPQGRRFHVEYGDAKGPFSSFGPVAITFEHPFTSLPSVVVTVHGLPAIRERYPLTVTDVTKTGFVISGAEDGIERVASWVALGH